MTYSHIQARHFNFLTFDRKHNRVTKRSKDEQKLADEIHWYLAAPPAIQRYLPEIVDYSLENGQVFITMDLIRLPTIHHLYIHDFASTSKLNAVYNALHPLLDNLTSCQASAAVTEEDLAEMYVRKTNRRLIRLMEQHEWVRACYRNKGIAINGRWYPCPIRFMESRGQELHHVLSEALPRIMHGDLCFSNLFVDTYSEQIFMIDPRGSFGARGIYGDGRYDLAKIRHSLSGYDHIIADQFKAVLTDDGLMLELWQHPGHAVWQQVWDELCASRLFEVRLIEALLFLSMVPLHADHPLRQLAMFGIGTRLLFETLAQ